MSETPEERAANITDTWKPKYGIVDLQQRIAIAIREAVADAIGDLEHKLSTLERAGHIQDGRIASLERQARIRRGMGAPHKEP